MKRFRLRLLTSVNSLLSTLIALLCMPGCKTRQAVAQPIQTDSDAKEQDENLKKYGPPPADFIEEEIRVMYGVPMARYVVCGTVSTISGQPLPGIEVNIDIDGRSFITQTNEKGMYQFETSAMPTDRITIRAVDPRGLYRSNSATRDVKTEGGDGRWNLGTAAIQTDIRMRDANTIMVKYGIPDISR